MYIHNLSQIIINSLIAGSIYALIASGFSLIYSVLKFLHLAHGAVLTAGAYAAFALSRSLGLPFILAVILAIIFCVLIGIIIDQIAYKPLRRRQANNLAFLISSLGVFIFCQSLIQLIFGAEIKILRLGLIQKGYEFFGAIITLTQIIILAVALALLIMLHLFLKKSRLGQVMRAVADDREAAILCGIKPERIITLTFALGSGLAAAAGILIGLEQNLEPTMGLNLILKGLTASVVGGIGSTTGGMLGGFIIGLAENFGIWFLPSGYKDAIAFVILILFLLFRPNGILGMKKRI